MKKTQVTLDQALRKSLPKMIKEKKALNIIVEILEDCIYSNNFDVGSNIVETITGKGDFGEFSINIHEFHIIINEKINVILSNLNYIGLRIVKRLTILLYMILK
jgi:hypothetical protein